MKQKKPITTTSSINRITKKTINRTGVYFQIFMIVLLVSCVKKKDEPATDPGDEIIGRYSGSVSGYNGPPSNVQVEAYKTGKYTFGLRKLSGGSFPDFVFKLDTATYLIGSIIGIRGYKIPAQSSGGIGISDSSSLGLRISDNTLSFRLMTTTPGNLWDFNGRKY